MKCTVGIRKVIRLGKRNGSHLDKARPIKLVLESEGQRDTVLKEAKNLRQMKEAGLDKVFIHQDLTPKERGNRKKLESIVKERQTKGEQNLIIVNGSIVTRRTKKEQDQ